MTIRSQHVKFINSKSDDNNDHGKLVSQSVEKLGIACKRIIPYSAWCESITFERSAAERLKLLYRYELNRQLESSLSLKICSRNHLFYACREFQTNEGSVSMRK